MDSTTGKVNKEKLKENISLAIDAYIHRVNKAPYGDTCIHLYKGPLSEEKQLKRAKLTKFLKSKKGREELKCESPDLYEYFESIWTVQNNHIVTGLPIYVFFLLCCFKPGCKHPRCIQGKSSAFDTWFPGGPPLSHLPLPKPDPSQPWGGICPTRKDFCSGHNSNQCFVDVTNKGILKQVSMSSRYG